MRLAGVLLLFASVAAADTKVRVTGLFSPDREKDLRDLLAAEWPEISVGNVDFETSEATLRFDVDKLFPKAKPVDVVKRLDDKLRGLSHGTFGVKEPCSSPREKLKRIEIAVAGLDCKACAFAAYEAVAKLDGVEQATASFREGRVTALVDPSKVDKAKLEAALKARGVAVK